MASSISDIIIDELKGIESQIAGDFETFQHARNEVTKKPVKLRLFTYFLKKPKLPKLRKAKEKSYVDLNALSLRNTVGLYQKVLINHAVYMDKVIGICAKSANIIFKGRALELLNKNFAMMKCNHVLDSHNITLSEELKNEMLDKYYKTKDIFVDSVVDTIEKNLRNVISTEMSCYNETELIIKKIDLIEHVQNHPPERYDPNDVHNILVQMMKDVIRIDKVRKMFYKKREENKAQPTQLNRDKIIPVKDSFVEYLREHGLNQYAREIAPDQQKPLTIYLKKLDRIVSDMGISQSDFYRASGKSIIEMTRKERIAYQEAIDDLKQFRKVLKSSAPDPSSHPDIYISTESIRDYLVAQTENLEVNFISAPAMPIPESELLEEKIYPSPFIVGVPEPELDELGYYREIPLSEGRALCKIDILKTGISVRVDDYTKN